MSDEFGLPSRPDRRGMLVRVAVVCAAAVAVVTLAHVVQLPHVPLCLLKQWTGYPCPGCGMTRSIVCLGQADLSGSLRMHPLGPALGLFAAVIGVGGAVGLVRGSDPVWPSLERRLHVFGVALIVLLVLVWFARVVLVPEWSPDPVPA